MKKNRKVYKLICINCGSVYELELTRSRIEKERYRKHCTQSCANMHPASEEKKQKLSIACHGRAASEEKELLRRKKISETAKKNKKSGGYRKGSGIGRGGWHDSPIAGKVYLDSTWELSYAKFLDESSIQWKRNTQRFAYQYNGELHYYIPDFFLVEKELFIEVKGYETAVDRAKWKQFPHKLQVIRESDLRELKLI